MKFYLVIVQNENTQACFSYDTYDEALAAFHNELAYRAIGRTATMCLIINGSGDTLKKEYWRHDGNYE